VAVHFGRLQERTLAMVFGDHGFRVASPSRRSPPRGGAGARVRVALGSSALT
jgi:hypothetical protein